MRIHIGAIGRLKKSPEHDLANDYFERVRKLGRTTGISGLDIKEYPESQAATSKLRKSDEANRLLAGCSPQSTIILLDEHGSQLSSQKMAHQVGKFRDDGIQNLAFLIGGPDGHHDDLLKKGELKIAFGPMTWPHRLVRIMLAEQIYRSMTILINHPYHRS